MSRANQNTNHNTTQWIANTHNKDHLYKSPPKNTRDVQCRRGMSLVAISVRVTLTVPGQPRIVSHT